MLEESLLEAEGCLEVETTSSRVLKEGVLRQQPERVAGWAEPSPTELVAQGDLNLDFHLPAPTQRHG